MSENVISFGAFDSELIEETIVIPDGKTAEIKGNTIILKNKPAECNDSVNKFNVGEWVASNQCDGYYLKILGVSKNNKEYEVTDQDGKNGFEKWADVERMFHKFSIDDAKNGDILLIVTSNVYCQIFMFKGIGNRDYLKNCIEYYCRVCDGNFYVNEFGYMGTTSSASVVPATQEQRQQLLGEMKKAGYMFDNQSKNIVQLFTEFEQELAHIIRSRGGWLPTVNDEEFKQQAKKLLSVARKQIAKDIIRTSHED